MDRETKSNKNRIFITMIISIIGLLLHCFTSLFITPKITNVLGVDAYGFVLLSRNFVSYVNIIMVAFNAFAARFVTYAYVNNNEKAFNEYYSSVYFANVIVGAVIVIMSFLMTWKLELFINIPVMLIYEVKILFLLTFVGFYFTEVGAVYGLTGYIKNRLDIIQLIKGISYLVDIGILIICFFVIKPRVWYMGLAAAAVNGLVLCGNYWLTKKLLDGVKPKIKYVSLKALNDLVFNGMWNSFNSIGNSLNSGLDLLVTNLMLTATGMGQIAIAKTFATLTSSLNTILATAFHPSFLRTFSEGKEEQLINEMKYAMKVCGLPINIIFAGFIAVGSQFLQIWIPTQNTQLIYVLSIMAMIPSVFEGPVYPLYYIYTLTIKNRIPCIITIVGGLANVLGMYIMLRYTTIGIYSILITTAVVMGIINLITNPIYVSHCLKKKPSIFYPEIVRNLVSVVITALLLKIIVGFLPYAYSIITLGWEIFLLGVLGVFFELLILFGPIHSFDLLKKIAQKVF